MKRLVRSTLMRFLLVGAMNTAFSYLLYAAFLALGFNYVLANLLAFAIGVVFSFRTQGALVFGNRDWRRIFRFALCWTVVFTLNTALIGALMRLGLNAYAAGAVALVPVTGLSYLIQRFVVFPADRARDATHPAAVDLQTELRAGDSSPTR